MQRKLAVLIFYSVTRVGTALKTNDKIGVSRKHIGNFTLALVAPVCAYNSLNHNTYTPFFNKFAITHKVITFYYTTVHFIFQVFCVTFPQYVERRAAKLQIFVFLRGFLSGGI